MTPQQTGLLLFVTLSALVFGAATFACRRARARDVDDFVAGGRRVGLGLIASSVMMSWVWTTTILGSAEAGLWYGVSGGFHYAWGAIVPFLVFAPVALRLRRIMPKMTTFTEFILERYGKALHNVFLVYAVAVCFYVYTEQLIGAGILYQASFGVSYGVVVVLTSCTVTAYIVLGGLRGSLFTDVFQFFVFALATTVVLPWFLHAAGGTPALYHGLSRAAAAGPTADPDLLRWGSLAGLRYGLTALVVAMGQVLFAQGYYQRAISAVNDRHLRWGYLVGGVLAWFPIPLAYGTILGSAGLALGAGSGAAAAGSTTGVAPFLIGKYLGLPGVLGFVVLTHMAATSTADTSLSGVQSILVVDLHRRIFGGRRHDPAHQIRFGRAATIVFGIAGAAVALLARGVSLLAFDIFSGILFAAPVGAFLFGVFSRRTSAGAALVSTAAGLIAGLTAWALIPDGEINWFVGNLISLGLPVALLLVLTPRFGGQFDFRRLRRWRPDHWRDAPARPLPEEA